MKVIIDESRFDTIFRDYMKKKNIKFNFHYNGSAYFGNNGLHHTLLLLIYKDGKWLYEINMSFGGTKNNLKYAAHHLAFEKSHLFNFFPSENVINFFSEIGKEKLKELIESGKVNTW